MRTLTSREKVIIFLTATVVLVYIVAFIVVRPMKAKLNEQEEGIEITRERIIKGREQLSRRKELNQVLEALKQQWGVARADAEEFSELIAHLESAANTDNVRILNIEPQMVVKGVVIRFPIVLNVSGSSRNVLNFIQHLQREPLRLNVDSLNLERFVDGNNASVTTGALLNGNITLSRLRIAQP